jgi:hypothetical protein
MIPQWLRNMFNAASRALWSFLKKVLSGAVEIALAQILDIAKVTVAKFENGEMSNEDKRRLAFNEIKAYALSKKLNIKDSIINLAIELSVAFIKGKF